MKGQQYGGGDGRSLGGFPSHLLVRVISFDMGSYSFGKPRQTDVQTDTLTDHYNNGAKDRQETKKTLTETASIKKTYMNRRTAAKEKLIRKQTIKWAHSSKRLRTVFG